MKKIYGKAIALTAAVLACTMFSGCGEKKEPEEEVSRVMEITITPEPTPTPSPDQINPAAVTKNGNLIMVNGYLADKPGSTDNSNNTNNTDNDTEQAEDGSDDNRE